MISPGDLLLAVVCAPGITFLLLAFLWLVGFSLRERFIALLTSSMFVLITAGSVALGWIMLAGQPEIVWRGGMWFGAGQYEFQLDLIADRLSLPLIGLASVLTGLVGAFSRRYMHREPGFLRFFLLINLFALGCLITFAAGSFDLLIGGWELVGISSALLVAFFYQRVEPVRGGVYVFTAYRIGDLGLLLGVFVLHYLGGSAEDSRLFHGVWPAQVSNLAPSASLLAALLFLFAACAKSAQFPFSGWLPRAMDGPTPSSAIFYGAISIHMGAYLLLRIEPFLAASPFCAAAVVAVGLLSAALGTLLHRVASDAKTSIAYAAMTQLGFIFAEIGFGFPKLALLHILGHAALRTLQFLRAPSVLRDHSRVHAATGGELGRTGRHFEATLPPQLQAWLYRLALDRGFLDPLVSRIVIRPVMRLSRWLGGFEPVPAASSSGETPAATLKSLELS